jgi:hypothetical protein
MENNLKRDIQNIAQPEGPAISGGQNEHIDNKNKEGNKFAPIYRVYRDNQTYKNIDLEGITNSLQGDHKVNKSSEGIFLQGTDIQENEFINSIPEDAIVIMDAASYEALPSLHNRKVIMLEKIVQKEISGEDFARLAKSKVENPKRILIYLPAIASHPEIDSGIQRGDEDGYMNYLRRKFGEIYPNTRVMSIDLGGGGRLHEEDSLIVMDRHATNDLVGKLGEKSWEIYNAKNCLKLPLSENLPRDEEQRNITASKLKSEIAKVGGGVMEVVEEPRSYELITGFSGEECKEELARVSTTIDGKATEMLDRISSAKKHGRVEFVRVNIKAWGLEENSTIEQIYKRAQALSFDLCLPEDGAIFATISKEPKTYIGMEPNILSDGHKYIFSSETRRREEVGRDRSLNAHNFETAVSGDTYWLFRRKKTETV